MPTTIKRSKPRIHSIESHSPQPWILSIWIINTFLWCYKTHPGTCLYHNHTHSHNQSAQWSGLQIIHTSLACKTNPGTCCWIIHTINQSINQWVSTLRTRTQCLTKICPLDYTIPKMFFLCVVYSAATINPEPLNFFGERAFTPRSARSQKVEIFESIWNTEIRSYHSLRS